MMIESQPWTDDRQSLLSSTRRMLERERKHAERERAGFFQPDLSSAPAYAASLVPFREALREMLGWPLTAAPLPAEAECRLMGRDDLGQVFRVYPRISVEEAGSGLLFLPDAPGPHPLVITLHGGQGSPELAAGLLEGGSANYREMIRGLRARGLAVYAPQLLIWTGGPEPKLDQYLLDREFRQLGGSRVAWDLCHLRGAMAWLAERPEIDPERIAVAGLSYGGFYALMFGALEPRLCAVVSSCFVNDRYRYAWEDWVWLGSARRFLDAEIGRLICPRPLFLEAGVGDDVFAVEGFSAPAAAIHETYQQLGLADRCRVRRHAGGHEYDPDGDAERFLCAVLRVPEAGSGSPENG